MGRFALPRTQIIAGALFGFGLFVMNFVVIFNDPD